MAVKGRPEGKRQVNLAVLIDADNAQASLVDNLFTEIAKYGVANVKRIYGDWTGTQLKGWKKVLLDHSIQPIQQFSYTVGKNATDSALIIDAMDLLFTRLASRIREAGLTVYGFGERQTPKPFVSACDKFIYTEILRDEPVVEKPVKPKNGVERDPLSGDDRTLYLLKRAVEDATDESGWAYLGNVGQIITNQSPDFDPRNFGYKKLGEMTGW